MSSAILIEGKKRALLLDCGEGCSQRLEQTDFWNQDIGSILLTHCHADHVVGLPMLLTAWKLRGRTEAVELITPKGLGKGILDWLRIIRLSRESLPFEIKMVELMPGTITTSSGHRCKIWANKHLPSDKKGRGGSYSISLELNDNKLVFSSDIKDVEDIKNELEYCNFLITESYHVSVEEIQKVAKEYKIARVILTHLAPDLKQRDISGLTWAYDNYILNIV